MQVRDIMTTTPACCSPDTMLDEVAKLMVEHDCGAIPVLDADDDNAPMGVVTDRDIVCRIVADSKDPSNFTAADCITSPCITVDSDSNIEDCVEMMESNQIRRIIVVDEEGQCCGIVSQADIARKASDEQTGEVVREVSRQRDEASSVHQSA